MFITNLIVQCGLSFSQPLQKYPELLNHALCYQNIGKLLAQPCIFSVMWNLVNSNKQEKNNLDAFAMANYLTNNRITLICNVCKAWFMLDCKNVLWNIFSIVMQIIRTVGVSAFIYFAIEYYMNNAGSFSLDSMFCFGIKLLFGKKWLAFSNDWTVLFHFGDQVESAIFHTIWQWFFVWPPPPKKRLINK